jgi:hypothetical protein
MNRFTRLTKIFALAPLMIAGCSAGPEGEGPVAEDAVGTAEEAVVYSGCWGKGPTVRDPIGLGGPTKYCHAYTGGTVYGSWFGMEDVGYLDAGNSWFVCQAPGYDNPPVGGGAKNYWWLWTQGDVAHRGHDGWGWFPANRISGGKDNDRIPNLPDCNIEW